MKIEKMEIKNFRSLQNVQIFPGDILALVGRNNSGKSNIIKGLELFFEGSVKLVNNECFHNLRCEKPIEITITFGQLSSWEKDKFGPWLDGDKLVVGREIVCKGDDSYTLNTLAFVKVPKLEWLREDAVSGDKIQEWWAKKDELKVNGLDFGSELGTSKPKVGEWKAAIKSFLEKNADKIPWEIERRANPQGYPGVLKGALPEFIHIPSVRDISDEAKVGKTNPFGQLINSVIDKISKEQKAVVSEKLQEIETLLNRSGEENRIPEIKIIEDRLNELMSQLWKCDIEIEMPMPQLKEVFGAAKIYANDGFRTAIEMKGHGLQRSMIFTILRAYAELSHAQKAGEKALERSTIFAIEEPELYLHPQSQRTMMSVFRTIAAGGDQVIYATQSSLFVDIRHFDQVCIMRRELNGDIYESTPTQLSIASLVEDVQARCEKDATEESIREIYAHTFNPMINEGFFGDKVVIVEGPSEQYALPIYADAFGYNFDLNNVSVVHGDGKGPMDKLLRVFNGFRIPTYMWFDADKDSDKPNIKDKTLELLELLGSKINKIEDVKTQVTENYAVLEFKLENTLRDEIKEYEKLMQQASEELGPTGKPLKNRFIASQLKQRIDKGESPEAVLPKTVIEIVRMIKSLSYFGSILKTTDSPGQK